jgi:hypothetical protein
MKKLILLMTAFALTTGISYAEVNGKGKKKKCAKGKTCCTKNKSTDAAAAGEKKSCGSGDKAEAKGCCKSKAKTVEM